MVIRIRRASEHNLKELNVDIGDGLTVITGVSGSGKTSLAFDTLYHESRRRFLDVFSLGSAGTRLSPANVESITGLGPAIAVGQNLLNRNPLSTLATASGLHPFLRLLYAHFGERRCPRCGTGLSVLTEDEIVERLVAVSERMQVPLRISAPLLRRTKGSHRTLLKLLSEEFGPESLHVDGRPWRKRELRAVDPHDLEVVIASLGGSITANNAREIVQTAASLGANAIVVHGDGGESTLSRAAVCTECGTWFGDLEPIHFHTPCPHCKGAGCDRCDGTGLHPQAASVRWQGLRLTDLLAQTVGDVRSLFARAELPSSASRLRSEIERRLEALDEVGLGYISLNRPSPTLSRGEAQRVRIAVALTSRLEDILHVLDEPTIGQHPADIAHLLPAFRKLAGPVVYVEHDRVAAASADSAIDLGPGAGNEGGNLLFTGTPAELWEEDTPTGSYFSLRQRVPTPRLRPEPDDFLTVRGARKYNLKDIDVPIPLGRLTVITGVSGSGKSTFVEDVLVASLAGKRPIGCSSIEGPPLKPVLVDQSPIGRNPRSNPATYTKLSEIIRDYYSSITGLSASHFSFNRPEGACPTCKGLGAVEISMRYLPSTWVPCSDCDGQCFTDKVLSARAAFGDRQLSIADLYKIPISEVTHLLLEKGRLRERDHRAARFMLQALRDVGLGYLSLGQPSPTLSGGEAQRVKLAKYLGKKSLSDRILVLDEPSTGLHPQDLSGLLVVLDRLVLAGATVVVVEHNTDIMRAADWVIDLGPGAGKAGGRLLYAGPPDGLMDMEESATGRALETEASVTPRSSSAGGVKDRPNSITIRDARAHNLKGIDVDFPKGAITVVTGVSGSGKSSLVSDILESEARRRFLETLSLYERQGTREGPEADVGTITGLGVSVAVTPERRLHSIRSTVGTVTEVSHHLAVLLASIGERACPKCGRPMERDAEWRCPSCGITEPLAKPGRFSPSNYAAACRTCHGIGSLRAPIPEKLIVHPEKPLCGGAMYSPGFFPKGYLCKPGNGGYYLVQALAARYGFDPATTPWNEMTPEAQRAFLFGDEEPMQFTYQSPRGITRKSTHAFPGFYGWVRDWDVGGTYTDTEVCPDCKGARLRPEYLAVTLGDQNVHEMSEMPLSQLYQVLRGVSTPEVEAQVVGGSLRTALRRLRFLLQVGLGYLHLNRISSTLSAGEAQRVKLAGLLGSGLTSLTVLLDEPSRGLHPSEVQALVGALVELRDEGNTVVVVEHDPLLIRSADKLVDLGPGAGVEGGRIVAQGSPEEVAKANTITGAWLRGERHVGAARLRRRPRSWLTIRGARANNLRIEHARLPMGTLVGICGVSGSGKSTLLIDTLGRALAPKKQTTSVARESLEPGQFESMDGAPARTIIVDQARKGVHSPVIFLDLVQPLLELYASSDDAKALGLDEKGLARRCTACGGFGSTRIEMDFLPDVYVPCETCHGTGYRPEAWDVRWRGLTLPELTALTIDEAYNISRDQEALARPLSAAWSVGLGYLVLHQPAHTLSGGEAQRLKIAKELCKKAAEETLYILDEPTIGQHLEDVAKLIDVLHRLVDVGHTVIVIEHHPHLLAACDWLIELGPGGGPDGGRIVASGTPEDFAEGDTPTAPYLREVLRVGR